jgi:aminobenzoyl-glutamate utilization protein B
VPTIGISAATWVPGTPAHSWYATAASGMAIGQDGMVLAAKVLAVTAQDLFTEPALVAAAKADFAKRMAGVKYESKIPLESEAAAGLSEFEHVTRGQAGSLTQTVKQRSFLS